MGIIYKITSPSNKIYIGKTFDLKKRVASHKCAVKSNKNILLHNSVRKYGWDAHVLEVIEEVEDSMLNEREILWISTFKSYCYDNKMGLNMTKGGDGQRSTWMHRIDLREKQSRRFSGEGNPFYGHKHTDEFKAKKSKEVSEYNKKNGINIPSWGVEKGRLNCIKSIVCYSLKGNFIKEYKSIRSAELELGISHASIINVCTGKSSRAGDFIFRYKTEGYHLKINTGKIKSRTVKRPVIYLFNSYAIEYPSSLEASADLKVPKTTINRAALYNNLRPIRTGHIFIYKDVYEQKFKNVI